MMKMGFSGRHYVDSRRKTMEWSVKQCNSKNQYKTMTLIQFQKY